MTAQASGGSPDRAAPVPVFSGLGLGAVFINLLSPVIQVEFIQPQSPWHTTRSRLPSSPLNITEKNMAGLHNPRPSVSLGKQTSI